MSEQVKVYVVTTGEYSDQSITGIFSSLDAAVAFRDEGREKLADRYGTRPNEYIEEYVMDERVFEKVGPTWCARCLVSDGRIVASTYEDGDGDGDGLSYRHPEKCVIRRCTGIYNYRMPPDPIGFALVQSPISFLHAVKVATEERQKWLREQSGPAAGCEIKDAGQTDEPRAE